MLFVDERILQSLLDRNFGGFVSFRFASGFGFRRRWRRRAWRFEVAVT